MKNARQTKTAVLRQSLAVLHCVIAIMCTGCLTRLGRNHSSLAPRMSAVESADSTFRSQDSTLPGPWSTKTPTGPGYSGLDVDLTEKPGTPPDTVQPARQPGPAAHARLLKPNFNTTRSGVSTNQLPTRANPVPGHSVPITANQLPTLMNQQSANPMSTGNVLRDQTSIWAPQPVLAASKSPQALTNPSAQPAAQTSPGLQQTVSSRADSEATPFIDPNSVPPDSNPGIVASPATFTDSEVPIQEAGISAPSTDSEPSVFDRLKGLYETPRDSEGRSLWKRQIQKLQSPWSVFRDRNERDPSAATGVPQTVMTEQPVEKSAAQPLLSTPQAPETLLPMLIESLRQEVENWPRELSGNISDPVGYRRTQQNLRLLYLIANEPGSAISSVNSLSDREQDFWQELMLAMAVYRNTEQEITDQERLTGTVGQLLSAVQHIRPLTALTIQRFEICSRIMSFGRVVPFPSNDFDPGQPVLLYVELENFGAERTEAGTYLTSVDAELAIFQAGNSESIETTELPNVSDESTSVRRDYFQSFEMNLPSHLATGKYSIRLRLRDRVTGRLAEDTIEFQVR